MLYDRESGKIKISLKEFIGIARRGISPTLPFDEDEPNISDTSLLLLRGELPDIKRDEVIYGFSAMGYDFELYMQMVYVMGGEVIIAKEIDGSPKSLTRDEKAIMRAEAFVIGKAMCDLQGFDSMLLQFYIENRLRDEKNNFHEVVKKEKLDEFFDKCVSAVAKFASPEVERVTERIPSFANMKFPFENVREGQREFMREAYKTLSLGGVLFASAPTGTGKTISAIYPALKALGKGRAEKIFYLTPKGTTAEAARDTINLICDGGVKLKSIILTRKDRMCIDGGVCKSTRYLCKYSKCQKIADATLELYKNVKNCLDYTDVIEVAKKYDVCPYELSLSYSELCDIVICDFNYLFDPGVYIRRFFDEGGRYLFLVDEAHNLVERARDMYSASLMMDEIDEVSRDERVRENAPIKAISRNARRVVYELLYPYVKDELREFKDGTLHGATHLSEIPTRMFSIFDELMMFLGEELKGAIQNKDGELVRILREYQLKIKKFASALSRFDECYKLIIFYDDGVMKLEILSLHTGKEIRSMINKGHGALFFSATLSPIHYYRSCLGGEAQDGILSVESPFAEEQLSVSIMDKISTRFSEREDTLGAVCRAIAATVSARRGNYMVFSPSFAYSEALYKAFSAKYPKLKILFQKKDMTAEEKTEFLEEFKKESDTYLIGFAVMGGIYSEGIDLAGDSLIGAVVVGIGMPGLSYEREAIAEYYQEKYEEGKQFAYIYPGMNRVFQAAGRVIRREGDRGVIVLIDDRFDDPIYKKSLPKLWSGVKFIGEAKLLREELDKFWREVDSEE